VITGSTVVKGAAPRVSSGTGAAADEAVGFEVNVVKAAMGTKAKDSTDTKKWTSVKPQQAFGF